MRIWSLHPKYLDAAGLVALWREALLARAVLKGETRGYRHHPQLDRFREQPESVAAIEEYLRAVLAEAVARGYAFDASKLPPPSSVPSMAVADGQLACEWDHLLRKLEARAPDLRMKWGGIRQPECHPMFRVVRGPVAPWEKTPAPFAVPAATASYRRRPRPKERGPCAGSAAGRSRSGRSG